MQVFFSKKVNFFCICSNTQKLHLIDIQLYLYIVKIRCIIYTIISRDCAYTRIATCFYRV